LPLKQHRFSYLCCLDGVVRCAGMRTYRARRTAIGGAVLLGSAVLVLAVGPWPAYGPRHLDTDERFLRARDALVASASGLGTGAGRFQAGWARRALPVPPGTPLAGYAARRGRPSGEAGSPLDAEALVVSDGVDLAAVVATDLLIVPPAAADLARRLVSAGSSLRASSILFNASHTHSGPGGFAPGWVGEAFAGPYDARFSEDLGHAFAEAILDAWRHLEPARLAHGVVPAFDLVRNRARPWGAVDGALTWLVVEQDDGDRLVVTSFAAHATVLPAGNMALDADYPGRLEAVLEDLDGRTQAFFLAGAVGSMGPAPGPSDNPGENARWLGRALAERVVPAVRRATPVRPDEVASAGAAFRMPPLQVRIDRRLRWSPLIARQAGLTDEAWLSLIRVGGLVLIGAPGDLSGEVALPIRRGAVRRGVAAWTLSFNGAYVGYVSPDRYYLLSPRTPVERYEVFTMSWCGPQQEAFLTGLIRDGLVALTADPG